MTQTEIDNSVAKELVRASTLYRDGNYVESIQAADRAVFRAIALLLHEDPDKVTEWTVLLRLLEKAVKDGKITNKSLVDEINWMMSKRNRALHEDHLDREVSKEEASLYIDRAYRLVGTVPYDEEQAKEQSTKAFIGKTSQGRDFVNKVKQTILHTTNSEWKEVLIEPTIGIYTMSYRPDVIIEHGDGSLTLVEARTTVSPESLDKLEWYANSLRKEGLNIRDTWLIIPPAVYQNADLGSRNLGGTSLVLKTIRDGKLVDLAKEKTG